ncbi:ATP-dependent DNA helicase DinG [Bacillus sp. FJAT-47783]|uniref:ATP-dependent DNA helicase DinG n=1 Tax=Bacillus sp. FJAT-47783 TaxID=2922712 RepID=UPI001FACDEDA|nr:ATP-dependent DNA helicase DinG [Bacillus sp. FJAT-47783]
MMKEKFAVVDIETTGNSAKSGDRIVQIAIVIVEGEKIVQQYNTYINPKKPIPPFIEQLTGIDDQIVKHAPTFEEVAPNIYSLLQGCYFVAHNIHFDLSFLRAELERTHFPPLHTPVIDTVELSRIMYPTLGSYKLSNLSEFLQIEHENPHRADSDAYVTALLFIKLYQKIKGMPIETLRHLYTLSQDFISDLQPILYELISESEKAVNKQDANIIIHRNIAFKKMKTIEKKAEPFQDIPRFSAFLERFMQKYGNLRANWAFQHDMLANKILEAFDTRQHGLIEIKGDEEKIISYLLPAIYFAVRFQKQVTIACASNVLLETIYKKMIPLCQEIDTSISVATLKGSKHYLSLHNFERILKEDDTNYDNILTKAQILVWLLETETGDVDEIHLSSGGKLFWHRLHTNFFQSKKIDEGTWQSYSYYENALKNAKQAQIIITNHAMLMADALKGRNLLSQSDYLIVDEAHQFERSCRKYFGSSLEYSTLSNQLQRVHHFVSKIDHELNEIVQDLQEHMNELFSFIHHYVNDKNTNDEVNVFRYRLQPEKEKGNVWTAILELVRKNQFYIYDLLKRMNKQYEKQVTIRNERWDHSSVNSEYEYVYFLEYLHQLRERFTKFFFHSSMDEVKWIEIETKGAKNAVVVFSEPIIVSNQLADQFFSKKKSVVLISNALTVQGDFHFCIHRLGLKDFYPITIQLTSVLDRDVGMKVFLPEDVPFVHDVKDEAYIFQMATNISHLAKRLKGKTVVLFSSLEMLKKTYEKIKTMIDREEFLLFAQGINGGNPTKMMKSLQHFEKGMLFCTMSFWNAIEIQPQHITTMIIVRLPFSSPHDPIVAANCERLTANGENCFYQYSLPEAILKFKDGIAKFTVQHTKQALFLFDRRIKTSKYGKSFLRSIAFDSLEEEALHKLIPQASHWLREDG